MSLKIRARRAITSGALGYAAGMAAPTPLTSVTWPLAVGGGLVIVYWVSDHTRGGESR